MWGEVSYFSRFFVKFLEIIAAVLASAICAYLLAHFGGLVSSPTPASAPALTHTQSYPTASEGAPKPTPPGATSSVNEHPAPQQDASEAKLAPKAGKDDPKVSTPPKHTSERQVSAVGGNQDTIAVLTPRAARGAPDYSDTQPSLGPMQDVLAKWRDVLARIDEDEKTLAACRSSGDACSPAARRLLDIVDLGRQREGRARLGEINRAVNLSIRSASDWTLYGVADLWSAPLATLEKGAGDCEDYAILKYLALRVAGISPDDLRLLIVNYPRRGTIHAVLSVHFEKQWLLLDNVTMVIVNSVEAKQYQPLLALDHHAIRTFYAEAPALGLLGKSAGLFPQ